MVAKSLAKEEYDPGKSQFRQHVSKQAEIHKIQTNISTLEKEATEATFREIYQQEEPSSSTENIFIDLYETGEELTKLQGENTALPLLSGPVTSNLETVLNKHKIAVQAFHGRSFTGNHCHKILQTPVSEELCDSIVRKTVELTDDTACHTTADNICTKFKELYLLFGNIHTFISHRHPIRSSQLPLINKAIRNYMAYFRQQFPETRITPKQHILECHSINWIEKWGFGMGLHGEQGGESSHAAVNRTKRKAHGLKSEDSQLHYIMKERLTGTSPVIQSSPAKRRRESQKNSEKE